MKLEEIARHLALKVHTAKGKLDIEVTGGYACDLLSQVMARAQAGNVWVTMQSHVNIVAVARLKDIAGIVLVNGREPEPATVTRADEEAIPIVVTALPAYEVVGRLWSAGIRPGRTS